jgi:arabinogalactan endo-1,4-beta-galactosidase
MRKQLFLFISIAMAAAFFCSNRVDAQEAPFFCIGADVSEIPANEARGGKYYDVDGKQMDPLQIMAKYGFNVIRLRLFVNPEAPKGYSRDGFCGTDSTIAFAKRIKAAGMQFALNFHYSDTWADPDKQYKPSKWEGLTGKALEDKMYQYTKETLQKFKEAGVAPDIVQIGNEINHGMVWPEGKIMDDSTEDSWEACMGLYKAGQRAVNEVTPNAKLQVHLALGGQNNLCREFLDQMVKYSADFDIIGLSYYEQWHETYNDMKANVYDLVKRYGKPVNICEYGANADNIKIINDIVRATPDNLGHGTMAWAPSRILFPRDGRADRQLFGIYEDLKARYSDPKKQPLYLAPYNRVVDFKDFAIGADMSWVPSQEDKGIKFSDKGVQKDVLEIMKDHHFNWVRLRLFVDPTAEKGYSPEGYCGLEQTIAMAKRIKAAGMKFLLDFHYSDNWADPGKQAKPESWTRFTGSGLEGQVYRYTNEVIKRFIQEGCKPEMVQVGNEVNHGMVWPQGKIENGSYESFAVMIRCASAGVRAADPSIKIMIHIACGGQNEESVKFFDKMIARDVKFDIIGQSYYPRWHGTLDDLRANVNDLAIRYGKPIVVVEYQDYRREVNDIVKAIPDGMGLGTFIWEATSPQWGNLFDKDGKTNDNMRIYDEFYNDL